MLSAATIAKATSSGAIGDDSYRDLISSSLAAIVVGGALWGAVWFRADSRLPDIVDDAEYWATFNLYRAYLYTVIGVGWLVAILSSLWFITGLIGNALDVNYADAEAWTWSLGPVLVGLIIVATHYLVYLKSPRYEKEMARFHALPSLPQIGPASSQMSQTQAPAATGGPARAPDMPPPGEGGALYCGRCGAMAAGDEAFCRRCGNRLAGR